MHCDITILTRQLLIVSYYSKCIRKQVQWSSEAWLWRIFLYISSIMLYESNCKRLYILLRFVLLIPKTVNDWRKTVQVVCCVDEEWCIQLLHGMIDWCWDHNVEWFLRQIILCNLLGYIVYFLGYMLLLIMVSKSVSMTQGLVPVINQVLNSDKCWPQQQSLIEWLPDVYL